jgi:hypothetical protein
MATNYRRFAAQDMNRPLTAEERRLVRWLLEHGTPEGRRLLPQLDHVEVAPWRCPCGCASINFVIAGRAPPDGGMNVVADFVYGEGEETKGVFVWETEGVLAGLEVWAVDNDAPKTLPSPDELQPLETAGSQTPLISGPEARQ